MALFVSIMTYSPTVTFGATELELASCKETQTKLEQVRSASMRLAKTEVHQRLRLPKISVGLPRTRSFEGSNRCFSCNEQVH